MDPSFSVKDYGASKLVDLVRAQDYLEVEQPDQRLGPGADADGPRSRPRRRPPTRKTATRSSTRTATKKAAEPVPAPEPEPAPEPVKHTVTTRKRSERKRQSG